MFKKLGLAAMLVCAGAAPAFAQASCVTPIAPAAVNGATVALPQMQQALADAKAFIAQSDTYQQCLVDYVTAQKQDAAKNKTPFDASIETDAATKGNANQAEKQKVGDEINASVAAYKAAHK